jgi:hypothetical protein
MLKVINNEIKNAGIIIVFSESQVAKLMKDCFIQTFGCNVVRFFPSVM